MDNSGAILCQISSLKGMLDQVNEEIEASIQVTREIESEIVKCSEAETTLKARESELTKLVYELDFELAGLIAVAGESMLPLIHCIIKAHSRTSVKLLEKEVSFLKMKHNEIIKRMNNMRDDFTTSCLDFQRTMENTRTDELEDLLSEKEFLEKELHLLNEKNNVLQNSMLAFIEEILEELHGSNSALHVLLENKKIENEKLLKDIDELKTTLLSTISILQ